MLNIPADQYLPNRGRAMNELNIVHYIQRRQELENLSNEDLARTLLKEAPIFGLLGELAEIAAERLSPGIVERMAEAEPQDEPHHVDHPWSPAPRTAPNPKADWQASHAEHPR